MMKFLAAAAIAAATAFAAVPAQAAVILFSDFDAINVSGAAPGFIIIPTADGWTGGAGGIEIQANNVAGVAFSGPNLVELDTFSNSSMFVALGAGAYKVSYWYSPRPNVGAGSNGIDLSIGNTVLDSVALAGGGATQWQLRTVNFNTTGGNLTFSALGTSDGLGGYLDSITISSVPEASTWAMLIAGFGLVGFAARRRKAAVAA